MDRDADYVGTGSRRGTKDDDNFVHTRDAFSKLFPTERDWDYLTEPQKELAGLLVVSTQRSPRGRLAPGLPQYRSAVTSLNTEYRCTAGLLPDDGDARRGARWCCADALFDGNRAVGVEFDRDGDRHTYAPAVLVGEKAADMMRQ